MFYSIPVRPATEEILQLVSGALEVERGRLQRQSHDALQVKQSDT